MKLLSANGWQQRQPREKCLLMLLAVVILLVLLWIGLQATRHFQQQMQQRLFQAQQQQQMLQQQVPLLEKHLARQQLRQSPHWQQEALALASEQGLQLQVQTRDITRLVFSPAAARFSSLAQWLGQLEQQRGVRATRLRLADGPSGLVLTELELQHDE